MLAYAAGDAAAFDALYARHKGGVYRYLLRHCGHAGIADELFQDVWMNVIRARATYVPSAKFTTWLYRIAHNRLIDHWRATGHVELVTAGPDDDADDPLDAIPAARDDEPEARASTREASERLEGGVRRAAGGAARSVPAAPGRRARARRDRRAHRRRRRDRQEPHPLRRHEAARRAWRSAMTTPDPRRPRAISRSARRRGVARGCRARSRRRPLDAAILRRGAARSRREAAARRRARQRWPARRRWWPLAAAATIAAIAVGVLQLTPPDQLGAPPAETTIVTDMPAPAATACAGNGDDPARAQAEATPPQAVGKRPPRRRHRAPMRARRAVPQAAAPTRQRRRGTRQRRARAASRGAADAERPPPPSAADATRRTRAAARDAAAPAPSARNRASRSAADARRVRSAAGAPRRCVGAARPGCRHPRRRRHARSARQESARRATRAARQDGGADAPPMPAPARRAPRIAAPLPVPDWIALIRRLRDEGKSADAAKELAAFRAAHADHEKLLPPDLRDWRPPEK